MINVVLASRLSLLREGMKRILQRHEDIVVTGELKHVLDVLSDASLRNAGVLVAAANPAMSDAQDFLLELRREMPKLRIVLIVPLANVQDVVGLLRTGVHGLVSATSAASHLPAAIRAVSRGRPYIDEDTAKLVAVDPYSLGKDHTHRSLTHREHEIFMQLVIGQKVSAIAHELGISIKTVSTHKARLMQKMAITSRAQLIQYAVTNCMVDTGDAS